MVKVKIWDLPIRIFHWLLAVLVVFSWYSAETRAMDWHRYSGYCILGLVIFRVLWGIWGSETARFANFVKGPRAVLAYVRGHRSGAPGHNPLGGWSVAALLLVLATQVASGLFTVDVDGLESGPLSYLVSFDLGRAFSAIHEVSFNVLLGLVAMHLLAIAWYEFVRRERLVLPMVHGNKEIIGNAPAEPSNGFFRAALALGLSALLVYLVSTGLRF